MMSKLRFLVAGLTLFQVFFQFNAAAQGNLLITPRRAVFEGNRRSIDLNLANIGKDTATYAISLVQIRMKEDGTFETITEPDSGQRFASPYIRYFPRSVTLGPDEMQTVKLQLVRTSQLTPGEYRSHVYFRAVPKAKPLGEQDEQLQDPSGISVRIQPIFGITIPAIIRVGESDVKVRISDMSLITAEDGTPSLDMIFYRTGNFSVYGDLTIDHISAEGVKTRVAIANGIAVYTPNSFRHFQINLLKDPGINYKSGKLLLTLSAPSDIDPEKYAEVEMKLGQ